MFLCNKSGHTVLPFKIVRPASTRPSRFPIQTLQAFRQQKLNMKALSRSNKQAKLWKVDLVFSLPDT